MRTWTIALPLLLLAATVDAAPKHRMALPEEFATSAQVNEVQRKFFGGAKPMKFGTFEVRDYSRGWKKTRRSSSRIVPPYVNDPVDATASSERSSMKFSYSLYENGEEKLVCNCQQREASSSTEVRGIPVQSSGTMDLECTFMPADDSPEWTFDVDAYGSLSQLRQTAAGTLSRVDERISIDGVNRVSGSSIRIPAPIGFTFQSGRGVAGAVDLTGKGTVLFAPDGDSAQRQAIAAAATALILTN
jgi:hypothetical protein